jgi:hypothetical protein
MAIKQVFSYGYNMPGYMPDSDPGETDDFSEAKAGLVEEIQHHIGGLEDALDFQVPEDRVSDAAEIADLRAAIEIINTWTEPNTVTAGGWAYWVAQL